MLLWYEHSPVDQSRELWYETRGNDNDIVSDRQNYYSWIVNNGAYVVVALAFMRLTLHGRAL